MLGAVLEEAENNGRDCIAVVGTDKTAVADIVAEVPDNDRIIFVAPGIQAFDSAAKANVTLPGTYAAAAVAGLLSTLVPQSSPTNKVLASVQTLEQRFTYGEEKTLVHGADARARASAAACASCAG